jgi:hypothetical protein
MPLNFTARVVDNDQTGDKKREMVGCNSRVRKEATSMLAADACHNADHQWRTVASLCHYVSTYLRERAENVPSLGARQKQLL